MNQKIVDYLQTNKKQYSQESLVKQLKNSGYDTPEINEAIKFVYNVNFRIKEEGKNKFKSIGVGCGVGTVILIVLIPVGIVIIWGVLALAFIMFGDNYYSWAENAGFDARRSAVRASITNCQETPLHCTITNDNISKFNQLIDDGVDLELRDNDDRTALWVASEAGLENYVEKLLELGANANVDRESGDRHAKCKRELFAHVATDNLYIATLLLEYGADINARNDSCETALHTAVNGAGKYGLGENSLEVIEFLLVNGIDEDIRGHNNKGVTASERANNTLNPNYTEDLKIINILK